MQKWTGYGGEEPRGPIPQVARIERELVRQQGRRRIYGRLRLIGEALVILAMCWLLLWLYALVDPAHPASPTGESSACRRQALTTALIGRSGNQDRPADSYAPLRPGAVPPSFQR